MIKQALESIGLTEGEIQVYQALVELGLSSTGAITKKSQIASSKVYEVLQRLTRKGLASYVLKNGVRYYDATPPERLIDFLEEKKEALTESQAAIRKILPELKLKRKKVEERNQTIVYTGPEGPKIALNEILDVGKRGIPNFGYGSNEDGYVEYFPLQLQRFIQASEKFKVKAKLLFARGFKSPNYTAQIRYLPPAYFSPVRTMIYGNKVAIVDFTKPITTIIIEKKEIAEAYKKHFGVLWNTAKP